MSALICLSESEESLLFDMILTGNRKKIGIKYCGGCNPTYERVEIIQGVRFQLRDQIFSVLYDEEDIDALIVVNGCPRACADQDLKQKVFYYSITGESDFSPLINWLKAL